MENITRNNPKVTVCNIKIKGNETKQNTYLRGGNVYSALHIFLQRFSSA